jgi:hypothetical protein
MPAKLIAVAAVAAFTAFPAAGDSATEMPADEPMEVNGIRLACTGVGDDAKRDPRWRAYAMRIEFANASAEYVSDVTVRIAKVGDGEALFNVRCDSPWVLADLDAGKYELTGTFDGQTKTQVFTAPKKGQTRLVVRFPAK